MNGIQKSCLLVSLNIYVYVFLQLAMGKMMDQGPVLIITFQAQLVMVIRNTKGEVVEGDPVSKTHVNEFFLDIHRNKPLKTQQM